MEAAGSCWGPRVTGAEAEAAAAAAEEEMASSLLTALEAL
jgi:hypothetical protein